MLRFDRKQQNSVKQLSFNKKQINLKKSPRKRSEKKTKCLPQEVLQIAEKRREVKGKGEKERYKHLNTEFQRIARRDKKAFLSDQCMISHVIST